MLGDKKQSRFDYSVNCALVHHIPQGETADGFPVIVFPGKGTEILAGESYKYYMLLTREAKYIIETGGGQKTIYRVAHAILVEPLDGEHADLLDTILYRTAGERTTTTIASSIDPSTRSKLEALKEALQARLES